MKLEAGGTWRDMMTAAGEVEAEIDAIVDALRSQPVPTIQLETGYERALAKRNLQVEHGVDDDDTALTMPINVVRAVTTPLPRELLATLA